MAQNTDIIDSVVAPNVVTDFNSAKQAASDLEKQFVDTARAASQLLAITGRSQNTRQFTQNITNSALATERLAQAQLRTAAAQERLTQAQARTTQQQQRATEQQNRLTQSAQAALSPFQQLVARQRELNDAARQAGASFGFASDQYRRAAAEANVVNEQVRGINRGLGNFGDNVGNYLSRSYGFLRVAANILPGIGISGIFLAIGTGAAKLFEILAGGQSVLELNAKLIEKSTDSYAKQITEVRLLSDELTRGNVSSERRKEIIAQLNDISPTYFGNLKDEQGLIQQLKKDYDKYNEALKLTTFLQAAQDIISEKYKEQIKLRLQKVSVDKVDQQQQQSFFAQLLKNAQRIASLGTIDASGQAKGLFDAYSKRKTNATAQDIKSLTDIILDSKKKLEDNGGPIDGSRGALATQLAKRNSDANTEFQRIDLQGQIDRNEAILDNDKKSKKDRLDALSKYFDAQNRLVRVNEKDALSDTKLNYKERYNIELDASNQLSKIQEDYSKKLDDINKVKKGKAGKSEEQILNERLRALQLANDAIQSDETKTYAERLDSVYNFEKRSEDLILTAERSKVLGQTEASNKAAEIEKSGTEQRKKIQDSQLKDYQDYLKDLEAEYNRQIKGASDRDKALIDQIKSSSEQRQQLINDDQQRLMDQTEESYLKGFTNEREYNKRIIEIQHDANIARLQEQLQIAGELLRLRKEAGQETAADEKSIADIQRAINKEDTDFKLKNFKSEAEQRKEAARLEIQLAEQTAATIVGIINGAYQSQINAIEQQKQAVQDAADQERQSVENSLDTQANKLERQKVIDAQTKIQQEQLVKAQNEIKRKQAIYERGLTIAGIVEQTALAAIKVVGQSGIFGIPLIAIVEALGALQIAAVLATPLPSYRIGTEDHKGGLAKVHKDELVMLPDGGSFITTQTEQLMNLPKHTKVKTAEATRQIIRPENLNGYTGKQGQVFNDSRIVNAIKGQKQPIQKRNEDWRVTEKRSLFSGYRNRRFK